MAPSLKGWPTASTSLTLGFIKRAKPDLGLECRIETWPGREPEVVRADTGTSPTAVAQREG